MVFPQKVRRSREPANGSNVPLKLPNVKREKRETRGPLPRATDPTWFLSD